MVSKASSGQAHYVEQVTGGEQISNVVQDNSATTAEERHSNQ